MSSSYPGFVRALEPSNQLLVRRQKHLLDGREEMSVQQGLEPRERAPSVVAPGAHARNRRERVTRPFSPLYHRESCAGGFAVAEELRYWKLHRMASRCTSRSSQLPRRLNSARAQGRVEVPASQAHHRTEPRLAASSRARQSRRLFPVSVCKTHITGASDEGCRDRPVAFQTVPDVVLIAALVPLERDLAAVLRRQRLSSPPRFRHEVALEEARDELRERRLEDSGGLNGRCRAGHESTSLAMRGDLDSVSLGAEQSEVATPRGEREEAGDEPPRARCPETRRTPRRPRRTPTTLPRRSARLPSSRIGPFHQYASSPRRQGSTGADIDAKPTPEVREAESTLLGTARVAQHRSRREDEEDARIVRTRWTRAMKRRRAMRSKPIRPRRFQSTWRRRGEAPRGVSDEC